jgi:inward rectifier potassium channel
LSKKIKDPGIGNASTKHVRRLIDRHGNFNVIHINKPRKLSEAYNYLLSITWWHFFGLSFLAYVIANIVFALTYILVGITQIATPTEDAFKDFLNAFFFSAQTFTTLGYGAMAPQGIASGIISSVEAYIGLMFFAFVTGLLYGRFSKPKAAIRFTKHLVFRRFEDHSALMFRIENDRNSTMINPEVTVTLTLTKRNKKGAYTNNFYTLKLERDAINYLPTTWTLVHKLDKESPLHGISEHDLVKQQGELIVIVSYYDESFNQVVHQMYSYLLQDVKMHYKFVRSYHYNERGEMVLDHKLFDCIESTKR